MPLELLLHLPRSNADLNAQLSAEVLRPAHEFLKFSLERVPKHTLRGAWHDEQSDEALCVRTPTPLARAHLCALRWALHHRFRADVSKTHAQLKCDILGGDESRLKSKPQRRGAVRGDSRQQARRRR